MKTIVYREERDGKILEVVEVTVGDRVPAAFTIQVRPVRADGGISKSTPYGIAGGKTKAEAVRIGREWLRWA